MSKFVAFIAVAICVTCAKADVDVATLADTEEQKILISVDEFSALTNAAFLAQVMWDRFNSLKEMRDKIHGGIDHEEVDVVNMIKRTYYKDGYVYCESFAKKQTPAIERGIGVPTSRYQVKLQKGMPERLKQIQANRKKRLATTNEVTIVHRGGIN